MSVTARLISGTAASWAQIGITLITQVVLVPLYLTYWSVEKFGVWLAIQSIAAILTTLDYGYQEYLGFELLKIGEQNAFSISKYLSSGIVVGGILGALQVLTVIVLIQVDALPMLFSETSEGLSSGLLQEAGIALGILSGSALICVSIGGLLTRALSVYGYYPRMAWWSVYSNAILNLSPALAIIFGAGLLKTGIVVGVIRVVSNIPIYYDMIRLLRRQQVSFVRPSAKLARTTFLKSLFLTLANICEISRQQGARLLLTPLSGAAGLAAFSTMRTGANVAMQGLHTVTNPLMPDLMRFLHSRDQDRSEIAFSTVWVVTVSVLAPALVILQAVMKPIFAMWTRNQIPFDPWLFALLSLGIIVYAISQPAISVVRGNNLTKPQSVIAGITVIITLVGIAVLVPFFGISGAGIALLAAEITAAVAYLSVARKWLHSNGLRWPQKTFAIATMSVWISAGAMCAMILFSSHEWAVIAIGLVLLCWNLRRYWKSLPKLATSHAINVLQKIPYVKYLLA